MWNRKLLPLLSLLLLAACRSSSTTVASDLAPGQEAQVVVFDARRVEIENQGPGRLGVHFDTAERTQVWLSAGGRSSVSGRKQRRRIALTAGEHPVSYRITESGGSGLSIQRTKD